MRLSTFLKFAHPKYLVRHRRGFCTVCGRRSIFLLTEAAELIRNHAVCVRCGSVSRHRHVAKCILEFFAGRGITKLSDLGMRPELKVFDSISFGPIVRQLGKHENVVCSEYFDGVKPGSYKDGILCEDFENLSFTDETFDLVISEDVFEHLQDYRKGFGEVLRVLKKGGAHIFCVPLYLGEKTRSLFEYRDGKAIPIGPVEYHGDSVRGKIPTHTHFGDDVIDELDGLGYKARLVVANREDEMKYGTFNCSTIIAEKK
jgi:SAM-dependent methyltransferase